MARRRGKVWVATGYDRAAKRKQYLGSFPTKREAREVESQHRLRGQGTSREACDRFAGRWVRDYPRDRDSTNLHNAERVKQFAVDFRGVRLGDVERPAARQWALEHRGCVPAVRAMFSDATRDGIIPFNPFQGLRLPGSQGRKHIVALTEAELAELAGLALDPGMRLGDFAREFRALVLFAGYVGLRPGELWALRRDDVRGQFATIERALAAKTRRVGPTKNGRSRTVIVPPVAQDALLDVPDRASGLLFETPAGRMWTQSSHLRYWTRLRRLANRPGFDHYELRHCAATMLLERGVTPWDVATQLGHEDGGQLVMQRYGHPAEAGARARLLAAWDTADGPAPIEVHQRWAS